MADEKEVLSSPITAQAPREVIMVRPKHFSFDQQTAISNAFQVFNENLVNFKV